MTDFLLITLYVMLAVAVVLTVWSALRSLLCARRHGFDGKEQEVMTMEQKGARSIGWLTAAGLIVVLPLTFVLADARPLLINGRMYADTLWLRMADMLINTSLLLIVVAVLGMFLGAVRLIRKPKR